MDDPDEEKRKMREAAMKVIGQQLGRSNSGRMTTFSPRWQTLIDDDMVEAYRASFRRTRRQQRPRQSFDTDSVIIPSHRPYSMSDLTFDPRPTGTLRDTDDNSHLDIAEPKPFVSNYGRLWKQMERPRQPEYLDSATGGRIDENPTVESSKYQQARSYPDNTKQDLPPDTFEMIPYPDYPEDDEDQEAETSLNNQATLPLRRRSFDHSTSPVRRRSYDWTDDDVGGAQPEIPPPDYKDVVVDPSAIELMAVENGRVDTTTATTQEEGTWNYECTYLGPLNSLGTRAARVFCHKRTKTKMLCLVISVIAILGLLVFVGVFPKSVVYLDYYQVALTRNTFTGTVDRSNVYYPGCYVLGPTTEFVRYPSTAHFIARTDSIFSVDRLIITLGYSIQYFLRPEEVGKLHKDYELDYESVIESIAQSTLKNEAGKFSVNEYRLHRPRLENHFHQVIKDRLQGNCCSSCCPKHCSNNSICTNCDSSSSCNQAYHIDVTYFQMGKVSIPDDVFERFLQQVLLQVYAETEYLVQDKKVEVKKTERMVKNLTNQASEIIQNSTAVGNKIGVMAKADKEVQHTMAYIQALRDSCSRLNITKQQHKLSFFMHRTLEDANVKGHLYRGYNFEKNSLLEN